MGNVGVAQMQGMQQGMQGMQQGTLIAMPGHCGAQAREVNGAAPNTVPETKTPGAFWTIEMGDFGWEAESGKETTRKVQSCDSIQEPSESQLPSGSRQPVRIGKVTLMK